MVLANEHEKIAIAIGSTMVGYEPKIAIAHNVALALGYNIPDPRYLVFRQAVFNAHRRVKLEWHPNWEANHG